MPKLTPDDVIVRQAMTDAQRDRYMTVIMAMQKVKDEDGMLSGCDASRDMWLLGQLTVNLFDNDGAPREWGDMIKLP